MTVAAPEIYRFKALGSPCTIQAHGPAGPTAAAAAEAEIARIERKYSRFRADSLIGRINAAAGREHVEIDSETAGLLNYADQAYRHSDGLFDITAGVLRLAWDFKTGRKPDPESLERVRAGIGWDRVDWNAQRIRLAPDQQLDFGGFGKEYAADRAAQALRHHGVRHGLVDLGGDIAVIGPHPDGSPWRIGIRHPRAPERAIARLDLSEGALATSGDYERFFVEQGRRYCHILNPHTGWPVQGPASVSVYAPQCLLAGTTATIAMLMEARAADWLSESGAPHLIVDQGMRVSGTLQSDGVAG